VPAAPPAIGVSIGHIVTHVILTGVGTTKRTVKIYPTFAAVAVPGGGYGDVVFPE
jgi:hypothetical protein